ncbi:MAG: hypothetical protein HC801_07335 [Nitrospira sp.]|nr:hypothetical protein [Nitrospira sp.]
MFDAPQSSRTVTVRLIVAYYSPPAQPFSDRQEPMGKEAGLIESSAVDEGPGPKQVAELQSVCKALRA